MVYLTGGLRYTVYLTGRAQYMVNLAARAQYARLTCQPARVLSTILPLSCNHRQALGQEPHPQITHRSAQPRTTQWSHGTPRFDWHCICKDGVNDLLHACTGIARYTWLFTSSSPFGQLSPHQRPYTSYHVHCHAHAHAHCHHAHAHCTISHTNAHQRNGTIYMWVEKMLRTVR
jgi:hypothetical protein